MGIIKYLFFVFCVVYYVWFYLSCLLNFGISFDFLAGCLVYLLTPVYLVVFG